VAPENIESTVERFRQGVAGEKFQLGSEAVALSASFGIAGHNGKEEVEFGGLVRQADKALYAAKRGGRNCVRMDG